jgi:hypothetical protein
MPLTVTIFLDNNTPMDPNVPIDLVSGGQRAATALTDSTGSVFFDVDPATLTNPAVRLNASPPPER